MAMVDVVMSKTMDITTKINKATTVNRMASRGIVHKVIVAMVTTTVRATALTIILPVTTAK